MRSRLQRFPRDFKLLLVAQFFAQGADGIAQAAFADVLVLEPTSQNTPGKILALFAITLVPYSVLSPFMGVFVDRWDRRKLLAGTSAVRVALLATTFLWARGLPGDTTLFVAVLILQAFGRLFLATKGAVLPVVLHEHDLVRGNSLSGAGGTLSAVTGGAVGLAITGIIGPNATLTIAGFVLLIPVLASLRIGANMSHPYAPAHGLGAAIAGVARDLAGGLREVWRRPRARLPLAAIFVLRSVGILIAVLIILLIKQEYDTDADRLGRIGLSGLALASAGFGALAAALAAPAIDRRIGTARVMLLGYLVVAASLLGTGGFSGVPALLALALISGAGGFFCKVAVDALVQAALPDAFRGRAFSLYDILYNLASVAGGTVVVLFQDAAIRTVLLASGGATLVLWTLLVAALRRAGLLGASADPDIGASEIGASGVSASEIGASAQDRLEDDAPPT